jgi:hypothetical protein
MLRKNHWVAMFAALTSALLIAACGDDESGGGKLTAEQLASGACDQRAGGSQSNCKGVAEYNACVTTACDSKYKECMGENYKSGDFKGSPCETYMTCALGAKDQCNPTECMIDSTCQSCFVGFSSCAKDCVSKLDCSAATTAGTSGGTAGTSGGTAGTNGGSAGTNGGTAGTGGLPATDKTCADLDACCLTLADAQKAQCQQAAGFARMGGDQVCGNLAMSYCP